MLEFRGRPWATSGSHIWKGAAPSFISIEIVIIDDKILLVQVTVHCPVSIRLIEIDIINIIEAVAWTKKYLIADSVDRGFFLIIIIGIIAIKFISKPTQIRSQCELINTMIVPIVNIK